MNPNKGDGTCASNPDTPAMKIRNRVAETLADPRFRPRRTRDIAKEIPRKMKHKEVFDDE